MSIHAQDVLNALDEAREVDELFAPEINPIETHFRVGDARMTVLRSDENWAIVFEIVGYNAGVDGFFREVTVYSNCEPSVETLFILHPAPFEFSEDTTHVDAECETWRFDRTRFTIWFAGQEMTFTPTPAEYDEAGILFEEENSGPGSLEPEQLLRFVCYKLDHPFFMSDDLLRLTVDTTFKVGSKSRRQKEVSHRMIKFLQTRDWRHTDFTSKAEREWPRDIECFQILARSLESGDLTEWNAQDKSTFNSDWRLWEAERRAETERQRKFQAEQELLWAQLPLETREELRSGSRMGRVIIKAVNSIRKSDAEIENHDDDIASS